MHVFIFIMSMCIGFSSVAQQTIYVKLTEKDKAAPIMANITIKSISLGLTSDSTGLAVLPIPSNGKFLLEVSATEFVSMTQRITIPYVGDTLHLQLESVEEEMDEVIVQSTRTSRTIANVPTRVETIEMEEIDEKNNMRPANVAMILHESTGIQVQQTSATSGNASIRLQGLDGKYTQLLKDGFPNFGNFSSGLSVLEIPPLDLKQVEIIKGPASPLYGGGAIAGVVNFISRTPEQSPEYNFIINHSNIGQTNVGGFAAQRGKKVGFTLLGLANRQRAYDVDKDEFTEVPDSHEFTVHPKLFLYPGEMTTIMLGNSFTRGERIGGDIVVVKNDANPDHIYFEKNKTRRNTSTIELTQKISDSKTFIVKQSFGTFKREIDIPDYSFAGNDYNAFTDVSYLTNTANHSLVLGANYLFNKFNEISQFARDNTTTTGGTFVQHTWDVSEKVKLESGLRVDAVRYKNDLYNDQEVFVLPRISLLIKYNAKLSSRIGGGIGYKIPTLFTEETETIQYRGVEQLKDVKSERSYGGTADLNYRIKLGPELAFSLNQMFFYTRIMKPMVLMNTNSGYKFENAPDPLYSSGFETNAKFIYKENFKLFLGYTFNNIKKSASLTGPYLKLVPRGKLNSALIYEKEGVIKMGLEGYFTGKQYLSNGMQTPAFKELGFMAEKIFKKFSVYINFENFTDTRQSNYKTVVNGSHLSPVFDEIWTHTEGFVFNGGIKLKL